MAAGLLKAAALTVGADAPAERPRLRLEPLQLSSLRILQTSGPLLLEEHEVMIINISKVSIPLMDTP